MKLTATFVGKPDQYNRRTIYIRINNGYERKFKATQMKVLPHQLKKGIVVDHPQAKLYNDKIKSILLTLEHDITFGLGTGDKKPDIKFSAYATECMRSWARTRRPETMRQAASEYNKFTKFAGDISLSKIDVDVLYRYQEYCFDLDNTQNTVWKSFKFVRKVINRAYKEQKIKDYPFALFEFPKYVDPQRAWLTDDELVRIQAIAEDKKASPEIRFVANWFLIGCYTSLRFSDWKQFTKKTHIVNDRLILYTTKTNEVVSMPLVEKTKALFKAVNYKGVEWTNKHVNELLKEIDRGANINKKISAHISRHTFGVRAAHVMSIEACARLMGISTEVCQVYYKIIDKVSDREYQKLWA